MKIDVHSHQIEEIFFDALRSLPGVTVQIKPDRFSYLLKDGKTWLPFRPEMFDPDHLIREMDRKGIDISILSMNTPSVYIFEERQRIDLARRLNDSIVARAQRDPDRVRGFATLPLPDIEASLRELERIAHAAPTILTSSPIYPISKRSICRTRRSRRFSAAMPRVSSRSVWRCRVPKRADAD
jgi:aminocarboxymuconate-semialdehyde decarboxylase